MKKIITFIIFGLLYALVTFFGLGPVLFADGPMQERMLTLAAVILIYVVLTVSLRAIIKQIKQVK